MTTKTRKKTTTGTPLLVTTQHKGVFFGYGKKTDADTIELKNARMAVYWSSNLKGVLGLAVKGPDSSCRIGLSVPSLVLRDVTAVVECSNEAVKAWEKGPWD